MDQISPDIFAIANPAFGALVIRKFLHGYTSADPDGAEYPLAFLPLPIVLSADYRLTFDGTNKTTGFTPWIQHHVEDLLGLPDAISSAADFTRSSLRFGCSYEIIQFSRSGRLVAARRGLKREPRFPVREEIGSCFARAERLGSWCGQIGSAPAIYNQLLITL